MEPIKSVKSCAEGGDCCAASSVVNNKKISSRQLVLGLFGLVVWYVVYKQLLPFSHFFPMVCLVLKKAATWVRQYSSLSMILPRS